MERVLKLGGIIYLETPNVNSWAFGYFKENWLSVGGHIFGFSNDSLGFLCERYGLRLKRIKSRAAKGVIQDALKYALRDKSLFLKLVTKNKAINFFVVRVMRLFLALIGKGDSLIAFIEKDS